MTSTPQPNGMPRASTPARASPAPAPAAAPSSQPPPGTPSQPSQPLPDTIPSIKPSSHTLSGPTASFLSQNQNQSQNNTTTTISGPTINGTAAKDPPPTTTAPPQTTPHDARTLHILLSSLGLQSYQDRVPLQLLDLAYRYTSSILADAAHLAAEGYTLPDTTGTAAAAGGNSSSGGGTSGTGAAGNAGRKAQKAANEGDVTLPALRLATSSRLGHAFSKGLSKTALLSIAEERNRVRLPEVGRGRVFGVRLPEERFLLTGRGWGLRGEESDVDVGLEGQVDVKGDMDVGMGMEGIGEGVGNGDGHGGGLEGMVNGVGGGEGHLEAMGEGEGMEGDEDEDEDGEGGFEDVFGEQAEEGSGDREDENMEDG